MKSHENNSHLKEQTLKLAVNGAVRPFPSQKRPSGGMPDQIRPLTRVRHNLFLPHTDIRAGQNALIRRYDLWGGHIA